MPILKKKSKINKKRLTFLSSGRGSNFQAVAGLVSRGKIPGAVLGGLVTDNPSARAVNIARSLKMDVHVVDFAGYKGRRAAFNAAILQAVESTRPDLIILAGFMKVLDQKTVEQYKNQIINIHPSLLPAFPGLKAQQQAVEYGVKVSGCTVHFVDPGLDTGPIILQKSLTLSADETTESLSRRILKLEHQALPEAVSLFCSDRLQVVGRRVRILKK